MNDYLGSLLHQARYRDLRKEAEDGRRSKLARSAKSARVQRGAGPGLLPALGLGIALSLVCGIVFTATIAAFAGG